MLSVFGQVQSFLQRCVTTTDHCKLFLLEGRAGSCVAWHSPMQQRQAGTWTVNRVCIARQQVLSTGIVLS